MTTCGRDRTRWPEDLLGLLDREEHRSSDHVTDLVKLELEAGDNTKVAAAALSL